MQSGGNASKTKSFYGGVSLSVRDVEQSCVVLNAIDVRISLSHTNFVIFCTTRRQDVLKIKFLQVEDIQRSPATQFTPPMLRVEYMTIYEDYFSMAHAFNESSSDSEEEDADYAEEERWYRQKKKKYGKRKMECLLFNANKDFIDDLFQCFLAKWSLNRAMTDSYRYGNDPVRPMYSLGSCVTPGIHGSQKPASQAISTARSGELNTSSYPNMVGAHWQQGDTDRLYFNTAPRPLPTSTAQIPKQQLKAQDVLHQPHLSTSAKYQHPRVLEENNEPELQYQNIQRTADRLNKSGRMKTGRVDEWAAQLLSNRYLDAVTSGIETELEALQRRRRDRQQHLMSHLQMREEEYQFLSPAWDLDVVNDDGLALCPHCGKYGTVNHRENCRFRNVECSWCGMRMKNAEFPHHANLCRAISSTPNYGASHQPEPFQPGYQIYQGEAPTYNVNTPPVQLPSTPPRSQQTAAIKEALDAKKKKEESEAEAEAKRQKEKEEAEMNQRQVLQEAEGGKVISAQRLCVWCDRPAPKEHDRKCALRRILCAVCHQEILMKDKEAHKSVCVPRDNPKKFELKGGKYLAPSVAESKRQSRSVALEEA